MSTCSTEIWGTLIFYSMVHYVQNLNYMYWNRLSINQFSIIQFGFYQLSQFIRVFASCQLKKHWVCSHHLYFAKCPRSDWLIHINQIRLACTHKPMWQFSTGFPFSFQPHFHFSCQSRVCVMTAYTIEIWKCHNLGHK